jgi:gas vesicle protein GvpN
MTAMTERITVLEPERRDTFVETPYIREVTERALMYLRADFPVHLRGPSGIGKTTLAMHIATQLGKPVMLIAGDEELRTSDLVGTDAGYRRRAVLDNFIHSVRKWEDDVQHRWVDNRLTMACRYGLTLVYDEFNRSRPEANNVLLSVLEEKMLTLPNSQSQENFISVHPEFRAVFTSNPREYAGIHDTQDALLDRMVTIELSQPDAKTQLQIVMARSALAQDEAARIVSIVDHVRQSSPHGEEMPSLRPVIMIGRAVAEQGAQPSEDDPSFVSICVDVLGPRFFRATGAIRKHASVGEQIRDAIRRATAPPQEAIA